MRRVVVGFAICASVLLAAVPHAQNRARVGPILAPRAIPTDNALIYTEQNDLNPSTGACTSAGRVWRVREVSDTGWEQGPSAAGLSLDIPAGVTLDSAGRLYIADRENRRLVRMDDIAGNGWIAFSGIGGNALSNPGRRSSCVSSSHGVSGALVDPAGRIYVSTANPQRVVRINDMNGAGWATFELPGSNFFSARLIAGDAQGRVYLADNQKHRIIRIDDISGRGLVQYGTFGNGVGQLNQPYGIAFDARGRMYIGDEYNHRIVRVDDMTGAGWTTYGSYGGGAGQLSEPHGVEIDRLGRIYIADTGNNRIVRIDDMSGAGEVAFGRLELQGRSLVWSAVKNLYVVGDGPTIADLPVFPFVSVGGASRTSFVAMNAGRSEAEAQIALAQVPSPTNPGSTGPLQVIIDGVSGSSFVRTVPVMGMVRLDALGTGEQATGYARLRSSEKVPGMAIVQTVNGSTVTGEAAWGPAPGMDHFTIYVDNTNGARTMYHLTNPRTEDTQPDLSGGSPGGWTNLTMTLRHKSGAIVERRTLSMGPGYQLVEEVSARFPAAAGGFEGTVEVTPIARNKIQATAVRYDNGGSSVFTALPVFTHPEHPSRQDANVGSGYLVPSGATTLYHPLVADGGSYQTSFILFNPGDTATTATVEFFDTNGASMAIPIAGASRTRFALSLAPRAAEHVLSAGTGDAISWGWARISAPAPIRGQAILQTQREGQISAETAVPASTPMRHFAAIVTNSNTTESGIALGNPNSNEVAATFRLRDATGTLVGEHAVAIPGRGRLAQFVTQLFPGFSEFDGTLDVEAAGGLLTGIGLRYDNPGSTVFTTTPVFLLP